MNSLHTTLLAAALLCPLTAAAADSKPTDEASQVEALYFDEIVESATRAPKPLSQIAENVTVVTAEEIEAMGAHTLAEVLNRVTGVFVQSMDDGYWGAIALAHIQGSGETNFWNAGSDERHVTLLVDGVPWNQLASNAALLNTVPVGIIDRIEVVKGPASSTWGSALGGVINVLTKKPGTEVAPRGLVSASWGERRAYDGRAEAAGAAGPFGYYLAGEAQGAEWERRGAEYRARSLFGKLQCQLRGRW